MVEVGRSRSSIRGTLFRWERDYSRFLSGSAQSRRCADELPVIACIREELSSTSVDGNQTENGSRVDEDRESGVVGTEMVGERERKKRDGARRIV